MTPVLLFSATSFLKYYDAFARKMKETTPFIRRISMAIEQHQRIARIKYYSPFLCKIPFLFQSVFFFVFCFIYHTNMSNKARYSVHTNLLSSHRHHHHHHN
mmetsp:Transcript_41929/g.67429  ORF Transcript_41929/g.67429 Transcript_41929/m.67429 type:complete len:101 (-) Transcript_41929:888-1190(-)